jgi:2-dehydro-3-deoxyphosphogluconate aldolase/(4S)-4-hydroxy-2-oxoglutarate aldolase
VITQFDSPLLDRIRSCGVVAVLVVDDTRHAVPLAQALLEGGVDVMELTLRTEAALQSLALIRQQVPDMLAGIGTILTPAQVRQVTEAGGAFGMAPGTNPQVIKAAKAIGLPFAPGILTPSDVEAAVELGCRHLKFFPAEPSGGIPYLESLSAPYAHLGIDYIPLGGIHPENLASYLAEPMVLGVGGSWLAPRDVIRREDWYTITSHAQQARKIVQQVRGGTTS